MTNLLSTFRSLLLLAARLLLYIGIALLALAVFRIALADALVMLRYLIVR
jgi:hypothetical protein